MPSSPDYNRDLRSWKEIAEYLGVTVRTAQRYEQELGLPVKRLTGSRGRIWTSSAELDAWKEARRAAGNGAVKAAAPHPIAAAARESAGSGSRLFRLPVLAGIAAACMAVAVCWWIFFRSDPVPARYRVEFSTLIVDDAQGNQLWRRAFAERLTKYSGDADAECSIEDLEGDGKTEILFNKMYSVEGVLRSDLICFTGRGDMKWTFTPGAKVSSPRQQNLTADYHIFRLKVARLDRNYRKTILTVSLHDQHFPTQVALVSPEGKLIRQYWHSGYLSLVRLADLNRDGRDEIYLGGVNNGSRCATVVVLDPDTMGGASIEENPEYGLLGLGPGREIARLLFPRSCINTNLKMPVARNSVGALRTTPDRLFVDTMESHEQNGAALNYVLDPEFRVVEVLPADTFVRAHMAMRAAGALDHDFQLSELDPLRNVRVLRSGSTAGQEASAAR